MKLFLYALVLALTLNISTVLGQVTYSNLKNYQAYYGQATKDQHDWFILRRFENNGKDYLLLVDPQTIETSIDESAGYQVRYMTVDETRNFFKSSPYIKALSKAESQSFMIQNAGIERGLPKEAGISLTADLCPSRKPIDRRIFTTILAEFKTVELPVPIALSVSGLWMNSHSQDLQWLKQLRDNGEIAITWINHSYTHRVSLSAPLKENFLLEPGTNIDYEVLETEKDMLKNGLLPSVFFRFPGLVSDQRLVFKITDYGLIPIGSDAWLAKGQQPQSGSIVLIHGNGNEPVGVQDFINLLHSKTKQIAGKQWLLYDLRQSVDDEFGGIK